MTKKMMNKKNIKEGLSDEAMAVDRDHEVQMARAQLYHLANDAVKLHKLLKHVSETEGLEGWVQSKITLAADYIKSVTNHLEYKDAPLAKPISMMPTAGMPESVSAGGMGTGSIATAPAIRKPLIRR